jgi:hypothetical protein
MSLRRPTKKEPSSPRAIAYWRVRVERPLSSAALFNVYVIANIHLQFRIDLHAHSRIR